MRVSVVVPTYQRLDQLRRTLSGLATQFAPGVDVEVIVVCDGSTDGTSAYLSSSEVPLPIVALEQQNAGPAAARDRGVAAATGDLLLFVDDDVVPAPDLIASHVAHHVEAGDDVVVIGPMTTPAGGSSTPWVQWEQDMLYKQYDAMDRGEYDATARQFYTGNASMPRALFERSGGFDTDFRRAEDVELAYRLADLGARFVYAPDAVVVHHAERSFASWLAASEAYGRNDVIFDRDLGRTWLVDTVGREFASRHRLVRGLARATLPHPRAARVATTSLGWLARGAGRLGVRPVTSAAFSALYNLSYYRGMAEELGGGGRLLLERFDAALHRRQRMGFVLEQTLGHITHTANLQSLIVADDDIEPVFELIPFEIDGVAAHIPGFGNWTVRAGFRARATIRRLRRCGQLDALFVHTQVPAILVPDVIKRIPTVVSLDATPMQYDELGEHYGHETGSARAERFKWQANVRCFRRARAVVAWATWTKGDLVARYEVPADKVHVIPPGVDVGHWMSVADQAPPRSTDDGPVRILFVGGDFARKGGEVLLDAIRKLTVEGAPVALDVVTRDEVEPTPGVHVHHGMRPNSPELIGLYHRADVFCLPTLGDCLPMVLSEAGAMGLPLVATDVGAIAELVRDGTTGLLVPVADADALAAALSRLVGDADLRRRLGDGARALVASDYDEAAKNAARLVALLREVATGAPA